MNGSTKSAVFGALLGAVGTGVLLAGIRSSHGDERIRLTRPRIFIPDRPSIVVPRPPVAAPDGAPDVASGAPIAPPATVSQPQPATGAIPGADADVEPPDNASVRHERLLLTTEVERPEIYQDLGAINPADPSVRPTARRTAVWLSITDTNGQPFVVPAARDITFETVNSDQSQYHQQNLLPTILTSGHEQNGIWELVTGLIAPYDDFIYRIRVRVQRRSGATPVLYEGQTLVQVSLNPKVYWSVRSRNGAPWEPTGLGNY